MMDVRAFDGCRCLDPGQTRQVVDALETATRLPAAVILLVRHYVGDTDCEISIDVASDATLFGRFFSALCASPSWRPLEAQQWYAFRRARGRLCFDDRVWGVTVLEASSDPAVAPGQQRFRGDHAQATAGGGYAPFGSECAAFLLDVDGGGGGKGGGLAGCDPQVVARYYAAQRNERPAAWSGHRAVPLVSPASVAVHWL